MNSTDRDRLSRLYSLIARIPLPQDGSGSGTASMSGAFTFSQDIHEILPAIQSLLLGLMAEGKGELEEGEGGDYKAPEQVLTALEAWVQQRATRAWERPVPSYLELYRKMYVPQEEPTE